MSAPADWLLELGHTRLKITRRLPDGGLDDVAAMVPSDFVEWLSASLERAGARFWLAAVPDEDGARVITTPLESAGARWTRIATGRPELPVAPSYAGLGVDRWLAVQPLWRKLRRAFCLVDCGSALTIDLVDEYGRHRGGWIAPGIETARRGLLAVAPVLRRDPPAEPARLAPATDTALAIENGLLLQQAGAIRLALEQAARLDGLGPAPELVLTGGAAGPLQFALDSARVEPDLVLKGLAIAAQRMESQ